MPLEYRVGVLGEVFPGPLQHSAEGQEPLSLAEASAKENSYIFRNIVGKDAGFFFSDTFWDRKDTKSKSNRFAEICLKFGRETLSYLHGHKQKSK